MKLSKWYLVQGENDSGNYATIKEEDTDLIVAYFEGMNRFEANKQAKELNVLINEHNDLVRRVKRHLKNISIS